VYISLKLKILTFQKVKGLLLQACSLHQLSFTVFLVHKLQHPFEMQKFHMNHIGVLQELVSFHNEKRRNQKKFLQSKGALI
jgi:hypothetical protein